MRRFLVALALGALLGASAMAGAQGFALRETPRALPPIVFAGEGRAVTLADFRGRVILLNLWATWCPPCVEEMPTLDRLQGLLGSGDFEVVALSMDRGGPRVVRDFFRRSGVGRLALYVDQTARAAAKLGAAGLPTTLLIDRDGREIGRLVGPARWDGPEMVDFLRGVIAADARGGGRDGAASPLLREIRAVAPHALRE